MADSSQGGLTDAATAVQGMEGEGDWELLPRDGGGDSEEAGAALRENQGHRDEARDERSARAAENSGNKKRVRGFSSRLLTQDAEIYSFYAIAFGFLPLLAFLHWLLLQNGTYTWPLPAKELQIPVFFVLMSIAHTGVVDVTMFAIIMWMREANFGRHFGVFLHVKLLFRLSLFFPAKLAFVVLASGIKTIRGQFDKAMILDAQESYRNCLGSLGCLPRTLPDLYSDRTIAVAWWKKSLGHSREDLLRAGTCLYEMLSTSNNVEPFQISYDNNGPHMRSFMRDSYLGAWLWMCALCVVLLEIVVLLKFLADDVIDVQAHYKRYARGQRRGDTTDATQREGFYSASLTCLCRTHYLLVGESLMWLLRLTRISCERLELPCSRSDRVAENPTSGAVDSSTRSVVKVANNLPSAAVESS